MRLCFRRRPLRLTGVAGPLTVGHVLVGVPGRWRRRAQQCRHPADRARCEPTAASPRVKATEVIPTAIETTGVRDSSRGRVATPEGFVLCDVHVHQSSDGSCSTSGTDSTASAAIWRSSPASLMTRTRRSSRVLVSAGDSAIQGHLSGAVLQLEDEADAGSGVQTGRWRRQRRTAGLIGAEGGVSVGQWPSRPASRSERPPRRPRRPTGRGPLRPSWRSAAVSRPDWRRAPPSTLNAPGVPVVQTGNWTTVGRTCNHRARLKRTGGEPRARELRLTGDREHEG